jgi:hypothetical protein
MSGAGEREAAGVDALFQDALRAGESRARARELLAAFPDEAVLAAVLRRAVPLAFLEAVASTSPWCERPRLLARVVLHPRTPRALALRFVGALQWRDLAEVALTSRINAAVRFRAESLLRDGLADTRLGDRVTLARIATPALLPALLADADTRVIDAALHNSRLREQDLVVTLRRADSPRLLAERALLSHRWSASYAVRLALVLQPRTPLPLALLQISSLVPCDLRRVAQQADLPRLVRLAAQGVLENATAMIVSAILYGSMTCI